MPRQSSKAKAEDKARFAKDLTEEVERIDRLIGLNREERRSMGIILNRAQLRAAKAYIQREIDVAKGNGAARA